MKIVVVIKEKNLERLKDGIRLALGLTINHRVSLVITGVSADIISGALNDHAFKASLEESIGLLNGMAGEVRSQKAITGIDKIGLISNEELINLTLNSDSVVVW